MNVIYSFANSVIEKPCESKAALEKSTLMFGNSDSVNLTLFYSQFHQHFMSSFCAYILGPNNCQAKL